MGSGTLGMENIGQIPGSCENCLDNEETTGRNSWELIGNGWEVVFFCLWRRGGRGALIFHEEVLESHAGRQGGDHLLVLPSLSLRAKTACTPERLQTTKRKTDDLRTLNRKGQTG